MKSKINKIRAILRNESGYALLSTLLFFILLMALGLLLLGTTLNSSKFVSVNKETVEDKAAAEMAIEEAIARIRKEMDNIPKENKNKGDVEKHIKSKLDSINSPLPDNAENLKYTISYKDINSTKNENSIKKLVTIKSPIGDSGKSLTKTITISSIGIAEVFKYGVVTPGSITFNGATYVDGDVLAKRINNRNFAKFSPILFTRKINTSYPAVTGNISLLAGDNSGLYYKKRTCKSDIWDFCLNWDETEETRFTSSNLADYFSKTPKKVTTEVSTSSINPISYAEQKNKINLDLSKSKTVEEYLTVREGKHREVEGDLWIKKDLLVEPGGQLTVKNGSIKVDGDAHLGCSRGLFFIITCGKGSPVEIKLGSSPSNYFYIGGRANIYNLQLSDSKMFVEGTATIRHDFNTNGTIYVNKDVDIQDLTNTAGTLVIVAEGNIKLANNSEFTDEPKVLNTFLYSNKELEIYGVGSNLKIKGGIYGNPIILNATKGKTVDWKSPACRDVEFVGGLCFEKDQNSIEINKSRLSIIYEQEIIDNPPAGIPTEEKITSIKITEEDLVYE